MNADLLLKLYQLSQPYLTMLFTGLLLAAMAMTSIHILLTRREPGSTIAWTALVWLAPFIGILSYLIFGVNRIHRRAESLRTHQDEFRTQPAVKPVTEEKLCLALSQPCQPMVRLMPLVNKIVHRPLLPGAKITPLFNGDQAYPAMLQAIEEAEHSINLASYIFDNDATGQRFVSALEAADARGVEVRVLIDAAGLRYSFPSIYTRLRRANIRTVRFLPSFLPPHIMTLNLRNHRKILVVDGKIGFTGGINIRDHHILEGNHHFPTRDLHFRVEGPVVAHLQEVFVDDWKFSTGEDLRGIKHFPPLSTISTSMARGIPDGPDEQLAKLQWVILGAITSARRHIRIMTPYFIPDRTIIAALNLAALRNVRVDIILPERNNLPYVHWAAMAHLRPLLTWGCRVFFTAPPFDHSKLIVIDDVWLTFGSANMDPRSLRLNFEFNVECWDEKLARILSTYIDDRLEDARELTLEEYDRRSPFVQIRDGIAALFSPYL